MDMNPILQEYVLESGIPIFGIASVDGFEPALPGWHPKQLMPRSKSAVVFGRPFVDHPIHVAAFAFSEQGRRKILKAK